MGTRIFRAVAGDGEDGLEMEGSRNGSWLVRPGTYRTQSIIVAETGARNIKREQPRLDCGLGKERLYVILQL